MRREKERVQRSFVELVISGIFLRCSQALLFCSESGDRLVRLEHVEDDGDVGVLPPQFRELVLGSNW